METTPTEPMETRGMPQRSDRMRGDAARSAWTIHADGRRGGVPRCDVYMSHDGTCPKLVGIGVGFRSFVQLVHGTSKDSFVYTLQGCRD